MRRLTGSATWSGPTSSEAFVMAGEFDLIARYFAPLAGPEGLGLKDDAALLTPPEGEDLVLTADANVVGVHILPDAPADIVARRLLRTNLSDLAAKGARPLGYLLTLALPADIDAAWVEAFAAGLARDQADYGLNLFGGDTVSTPGPVVASITAFGAVASGRMLRREGAAPGDALFVTGSIGDGAFGLEAASGGLTDLTAEHRAFLADRYLLPRPPVAFGQALAASGLATAAADVSDGLIADAGHVAEASGVAIDVAAAATPFSPAAQAVLAAAPARLAEALTGGDDYEIVFAAPPDAEAALRRLAEEADTVVTRIGDVRKGAGVRALAVDGAELPLDRRGFEHL